MDNSVIKSYVWHNGKCFFVSTIERDSSAMLNPGRYNETIVWEYDWAKAERGKMIHQGEDGKGCIGTHLRVCKDFYLCGMASDIEY